MPALIKTRHSATITWLGYVPHRDDPELVTRPLERMPLTWGGYEGDCHAGVTRPSCSRVTSQHPRNTEIRNARQLSIVSAEDLRAIAAELGLEAIDPAWLGASIVLEGIADLTYLPPSSRLQAPDGATLTVDMENLPCQFPALTIEKARPGRGKAFRSAAKGRRGITAWVERCGALHLGETMTLHVPAQRAWRGAAA
ncbi:MOSC domain-containing protein [Oceaniglobus indicus]|uniref:MOSC domain-containing protein n=1 Tax=Oceaniglobus indicus TaxID=2047749 RepID=UPI000C18D197|nr:MOSC domain-containing protein [Oceaniglobus indicus]